MRLATRRDRRGLLLALVLVGGLASAAEAPVASPASAAPPEVFVGVASPASVSNGNAYGNGKNELVLTVTGSSAVAPGRLGSVDVTVRNSRNQPVLLTDVIATVTSVTSGAGPVTCRASWYRIDPFSGSRSVAKKGSTVVTLPVSFVNLPDVDQGACKGARYSFSLYAKARQQ